MWKKGTSWARPRRHASSGGGQNIYVTYIVIPFRSVTNSFYIGVRGVFIPYPGRGMKYYHA